MKVALEPARVRGFRFAGVSAGLKTKAGALDLGIIAADRPCAAAAVFSANRVKAAPVYVTAERVKSGHLQAVVANSGCANSFTGAAGMRLARESCAHVARLLGCAPDLVVPSSTGVIGHLYDLDKFKRGAVDAVRSLREDGLDDFAHAIMTTDTRPKMASTRFKAGGATITLAGAVKGVGMISPKMATMLGYLVTDAMVAPSFLKKSLKAALPNSFNAITVDGDMSTNDTVIIMASGAAANRAFGARDQAVFDRAVEDISAALARELVRDGEGATKLVSVEVRGARTVGDAERAARQIANSPLVKTAFFGCDPNVGRILMAAGSSGAYVQSDKLVLWIGGVKVAAHGRLLTEALADAGTAMKSREFVVRLDLRLGKSTATILTCDLSYDYVRINAEYTT
ncbi:bifunctional glutamate N-acetyltransferase/amino-acid acetyltransferase ArgJ [Candidatus Binatus sp.]|uniref:bifunctional glutamate N-acetyltransferase/amino-acid acetyltransferase ArgJ n=1 Tax=Candidatus Binatus sp. TaxID=2811406 RepID=UPI003CC66E86